MRKWQVVEEENIADLAIQVFGKDEPHLFQNLLEAFTSIITNLKVLKENKEFSLKLIAEDISDLVFFFVEKLIYLKDAKQLLFKKGDFQVMFSEKGYTLYARLSGQKITSDLPIKIDIKALTRHKFKVTKGKYYKVTLVFDI